MKKLFALSLLALCLITRPADQEWEWVRVFQIKKNPYAPHDRWMEPKFHISKEALRTQPNLMRDLYDLERKEVKQLLCGELPDRYEGYHIEFGCGNGYEPSDDEFNRFD